MSMTRMALGFAVTLAAAAVVLPPTASADQVRSPANMVRTADGMDLQAQVVVRRGPYGGVVVRRRPYLRGPYVRGPYGRAVVRRGPYLRGPYVRGPYGRAVVRRGPYGGVVVRRRAW